MGRFENLKEHSFISKKLNISIPKLGPVNKTNHEDLRNIMTTKQEKLLVKDIKDIDFFGYTFN